MEESNQSANQFNDRVKYKMNNEQRGIALIFNQRKFKVPGLPKRRGTENDGLKLKTCFTNLGFVVKYFQDKKFSDIKKRLLKASKENHSKRDCLVVVVLTHGDYGILYAKDQAYREEELWTPFTGQNCNTLEGKPKLFFIQACRGGAYDPGITLVPGTGTRVFQPPDYLGDNNVAASNIAENSNKMRQNHVLDLEHDFLVAHSTVPDYVSWKWGGAVPSAWFIHELCEELNKKPSDHLLTILSNVNSKVAIDHQSHTEYEVTHHKKQIPCISSTLRKLVFFY